ncbi:hypothetical protein E2C01_088654 [Portunus trituberculatus]|uniref:Uncharacterized protein n=1 Tax=Portunus trituberculatus TaxID=210409 RepID=A0A5B7JBB8_PORTR|nr:hypothetical protein [Portunus trituberculatus]
MTFFNPRLSTFLVPSANFPTLVTFPSPSACTTITNITTSSSLSPSSLQLLFQCFELVTHLSYFSTLIQRLDVAVEQRGFPCCFLEHEVTPCDPESQSQETERRWENNAGSGEMGRGSMHSIEAQKFLGPQSDPLNR